MARSFHTASQPFFPAFENAKDGKLRGIPLVATWVALTAAPWVAIYHLVQLLG